MVIASIVYTVFFKILGLVQNDLESTGIFALISSDWRQGNKKRFLYFSISNESYNI